MYNLFISHSWSYSDAYNKLTSLLDNANYFTYKNYSVPKDDPAINEDLLRFLFSNYFYWLEQTR